jgi:hypothetical protein
MSDPIHQPPLRQLLKRAAYAVDAVVHKGQNLNRVLADQPVAGRATVQDICYGSLREYALLAALRDALLSNPLKDSVIAALLVVAPVTPAPGCDTYRRQRSGGSRCSDTAVGARAGQWRIA